MTKELTKKLTNRFNFFRMNFGFEHGDGWFKLVWNLCEDLDKLEKERWAKIPADEKASLLLKGEDSGLRVVQVKEKFGTLRFYVDNADDAMYKRIHKAEHDSSSVCEICGKPAKLDESMAWVRTLCPDHMKKDRNAD
jgi:hypothetical protein